MDYYNYWFHMVTITRFWRLSSIIFGTTFTCLRLFYKNHCSIITALECSPIDNLYTAGVVVKIAHVAFSRRWWSHIESCNSVKTYVKICYLFLIFNYNQYVSWCTSVVLIHFNFIKMPDIHSYWNIFWVAARTINIFLKQLNDKKFKTGSS